MPPRCASEATTTPPPPLDLDAPEFLDPYALAAQAAHVPRADPAIPQHPRSGAKSAALNRSSRPPAHRAAKPSQDDILVAARVAQLDQRLTKEQQQHHHQWHARLRRGAAEQAHPRRRPASASACGLEAAKRRMMAEAADLLAACETGQRAVLGEAHPEYQRTRSLAAVHADQHATHAAGLQGPWMAHAGTASESVDVADAWT